MSRNLCSTSCRSCGSHYVVLVGKPHEITRKEAGRYFEEYEGMVVANAGCQVCGAEYLAWIDETKRRKHRYEYANGYVYDFHRDGRKALDGDDFIDLSYRRAFNDEPSEGDEAKCDPRRYFLEEGK